MSEDTVNEQATPGIEKFTTKASKEAGAREITLEYDFGATLDDLSSKFSSEVIYTAAVKSLVISLQAYIRRLMNGEKPSSDEEIQKAVADWNPSVRQTRTGGKDAIETLAAKFAKLSKEKQEAFLAQLMGQMK